MAAFIYTRAATMKVYDDLKKFIYGFSISMQALYIGYLVYALVVGAGILWINAVLGTLSLAYLMFMIVNHNTQEKLPKDTVSAVGKAYRWSKICAKAFTLGVTLYGIHMATTTVTTATVIFAALTTILWILSVMFELIKFVFERYYELIESAISKDVYQFKKIINFIPGKKAEEPKISESVDKKLNDLGDKLKVKIEAEKLVKKEEKKAKRKDK